MFLASGCSSVARNGARGGGGGGLPSAYWGHQRCGGNSAGMWGQQWRGLQPLRTSLHAISISPKQFELKQSWKALRALNARWALPVYPVFEDEKSKTSYEKSVKTKIAERPTGYTSFESNQKVTLKVEECSRTETQKRSSKNFALKTNTI